MRKTVSGGRAGDEDMLYRYEIGKQRLEEFNAVATPNALAGSIFYTNIQRQELRI